MRVAVLLDRTVRLDVLASRAGHLSRWFDAYVIDALHDLGHEITLVQFGPDPQGVLGALDQARPDVVFNLALGAFGDRSLQAYPATLLELGNFAYTGAGPRGLTLAGDKALSKALLRDCGITVPAFMPIQGADEPISLRYPVLVKARTLGGSDVSVWPRHLEMTWPVAEHRVHGEHGRIGNSNALFLDHGPLVRHSAGLTLLLDCAATR